LIVDHDLADSGIEFAKNRWNLNDLKLIISVIYDRKPFFMNQRLLRCIAFDLVKAASVEGKTRSLGQADMQIRMKFS